MTVTLNVTQIFKMIEFSSRKLESKRDYINSLNVFPVPDGDTGTNLCLTYNYAVEELKKLKEVTLNTFSKVFSKSTLIGARGNSGVIFSQIIRGICGVFENLDEITVYDFKKALEAGKESAYKAIMKPVEGTMLTIIRYASEINPESDSFEYYFKKLVDGVRYILHKTPEMLQSLKEAGVVDSGGMALLVIFEGMSEALTGVEEYDVDTKQSSNDEDFIQGRLNSQEEFDIRFPYCTEYIIRLDKKIDKDMYEKYLIQRGDSIALVEFEDIFKVHVHSANPGELLDDAVKYGELIKIKIDNMKEQQRENIQMEEMSENKVDKKNLGIVSISNGDGFEKIFNQLGVDSILVGGQSMNPSIKNILEEIEKINSDNIIVFPNNKNVNLTARNAAENSNKNVKVIDTISIQQNVIVLGLMEDDVCFKEFEQVCRDMNDSLNGISSISITKASKDTVNKGKKIIKNDYLGILNDDIVCSNHNLYYVVKESLNKSKTEDSFMVSLFRGKNLDEMVFNNIMNDLIEEFDFLEFQSYYGGQDIYDILIALE